MSDARASGPGGPWALGEAMRPGHWVKNGFVAVPIVFGGRYTSPEAWGHCLLAVLSFCLLSSAVYLINDILDRDADRQHPRKRTRPIASGRLSEPLAAFAAAALVVLALALTAVSSLWPSRGPTVALGGGGLILWAACYFVLNLLYSTWLKHHVYIDVIAIALGFVLRAMAGAAAVAVGISPWLVVCTFTLCLFLGFTKRRGEMMQLSQPEARASRRTHGAYELPELGRLITISAGLAIMTYSLYCLAPRTIQNLGSGHMIWTIPLVIYGIFRYDGISRRTGGGDVVEVLGHDWPMWATVGLYLLLALLVMQFGRHPAISSILDVYRPR
jgi:4-hydroxybenzoate polyprenyltransferase